MIKSTRRTGSWLRCGLHVAFWLGLSSGLAMAANMPVAEDFGGRAVLDLSDSRQPWDPALKPSALASNEKLAPRGDCGEFALGQVMWLDESKPGSAATESTHLGTDADFATREGGRLTLAPGRGKPIVLTDWATPESGSEESERRRFRYLGALDGTPYRRVEIQYGHDSPGSLLIHRDSGDVVYAHNGDRVVALSPDARHLVTFDEHNSPHRLVLASLGPQQASVLIECRFERSEWRPSTCGWTGEDQFLVSWSRGGTTIAGALQRRGDGWEFAAQPALDGPALECRVAPAPASAQK